MAMRRPVDGFTLVELLVVLAIMAVATSAVLFAMPDPGRRARDSAERFSAQADAARDAAILASSSIAIRFDPGGYHFERRDAGQWQPIAARPFAPVAWPEGISARTTPAGETRIRFDATGLADPVRLTLFDEGASASVTIGAGGEVRLAR